jgi:hypothetical protein
MKTARPVLVGAAFGGSAGGIVGGGIAELFAGQGPGMHGSLWLAAVTGAIVGGAFSALVTRSGLCKSSSTDASAGQSSHRDS